MEKENANEKKKEKKIKKRPSIPINIKNLK